MSKADSAATRPRHHDSLRHPKAAAALTADQRQSTGTAATTYVGEVGTGRKPLERGASM